MLSMYQVLCPAFIFTVSLNPPTHFTYEKTEVQEDK